MNPKIAITRIAFLFLLFVLCAVTALAQTTTLTDDTHTNSNKPNKNFGAAVTVKVREPVERGLLKFKLTPNLPPGTTGSHIGKATLRLFVGAVGAPGQIEVQRVMSAWTEQSVTDATFPTLGALEAVIAINAGGDSKWVTVDVTQLVKDWLDGVLPNNGVSLVASVGTDATLDSKENTGTSHEPRLEIVLNHAATADQASNAAQLGGVDAAQFIKGADPRLTDSRPPTAGSANYIQNTKTPQAGADFNVSGDGTTGGTLSGKVVNAQTQFNLGGQRVLGVDASGGNFYAGVGAGAVSRGPGNTFVGFNAGAMNDTGQLNSFFGFRAGEMNVDGQGNAFFGTRAGSKNVFGGGNAFFGRDAGSNSTANFNSFFGSAAGFSNTTGERNSFFGVSGGFLNTTGSDNSFFGHVAGRNTTASNNSFFGSLAGRANTTGFDNAFFGQGAGNANLTGAENSFFGKSAGLQNTTGGENSFFGINAGINNLSGGANTFFGASAGTANQAGFFNTFVGRFAGLNNIASLNAFFGAGAGEANTTGTDNTFVGTSVGAANVTGRENSFFGRNAGRNNTASRNSFFGFESGKANTSGTANTFFGYHTGFMNTMGGFNTFVGDEAGVSNTTGEVNTFVGNSAGQFNMSGFRNSFFGNQAGFQNTTGFLNTIIGNLAGEKNTEGSFNAFLGSGAGNTNTKGNSNSFFGRLAGRFNTEGNTNAFFGNETGLANTIGSNNTLIGYLANVGVDGLTNATAIGSGAVVSQSNSLVLGNNANVGIGTPSPNSKLTVVGLIESTTGGVKFPDGTIQTTAGGGGAGVTSLNGLTNNVTLAAGSNITITPAGNTLTIAATGGGGNSILNQTTQQTSANFNIDGTGTASVFNAGTQYNLGGQRVLGTPGQNNLFAGIGAGAVTPVLGDNNIENTFFGRSAGQNNIDCCNAFFGNYAGQNNTSGGGNTFLGYQAGIATTQGSNNTFVGINSGSSFNTGGGNTFVGNRAGNVATSGTNNTMLGQNANFAFGTNNLSFATAIGAGATVSTSNTIVLGRAADTVSVPGTFTSPSDIRLKTGVANMRYGLSEVMRLRPVTWAWKNDSRNSTRLGLIAQEVKSVLPELVVEGSDKDHLLSMNYIGLLPVVIRAIQEQEATIATLRNEIAGLQKQTTGGTADTSVGIGTTAPKARLEVKNGNILVGSPGQGIILKSPDGVTCKLLSIDNAGAMVLAATACP